jgi:hypothetical protein
MESHMGVARRSMPGLSMLALTVLIFCGCGDDGAGPGKKKLTCTAGCSSMSWGIEGETGAMYVNTTCTRNYVGNNYIETCTGSRTYDDSGHTYNFTAVYNWIDCSISVTVDGVGTCTDS